jgi:CheY-like chemotaxis protein
VNRPEINVLLIEDSLIHRRLIEKMLKSIGDEIFNIKCSDTLTGGISLLSKENIDVLLLDLTLPDSSERETISWMKDQKMPIVIITGNEDGDFITNALKCGAQDYLIKSKFDEFLLEHCIIYAYERWKSNGEIIEGLLKEGEDKYKNLFEQMTSGVAVYEHINNGSDFIFKDINKAGEQISRIKKEDIIGKRIREVFPGVDELGLFDVLVAVWDSGEAQYLAVDKYKDDRISHWVENYVYKLTSGEIVTVYNDLTDKKESEIAMKNTINDLRAFKEIAVDRENVMIRLKQEVNKLSVEAGLPEPYKLSFLE